MSVDIREQIERLRNEGWYACDDLEASAIANSLESLVADKSAIAARLEDCAHERVALVEERNALLAENERLNIDNAGWKEMYLTAQTRNTLLEAVLEAANKLQNEVHGSLQYLDRDVCGNTNYVCLQTAAIATREAINNAEREDAG